MTPYFRTLKLTLFDLIAFAFTALVWGNLYVSSLSAAPSTPSQTQSRQVLQQGTVMGFRHYDGKAVWENLQVGQALALVREPDNPHDSQAIRIEWQGHKLGYAPRADNTDLARLIDNGASIEARIIKLEKSRRPNNRVRFEVYLPNR